MINKNLNVNVRNFIYIKNGIYTKKKEIIIDIFFLFFFFRKIFYHIFETQ